MPSFLFIDRPISPGVIALVDHAGRRLSYSSPAGQSVPSIGAAPVGIR